MTTHDLVCIVGALCGLIMVSGGIFLLYKGNVTLDAKPVPDALQVEFRKMFRITTQYPALGLFVIGLVFIVSASMSTSDPSLRLRANIAKSSSSSDPTDVLVRVSVGQWIGKPATDGALHANIRMPLTWMVEVTAPGYSPAVHQITSLQLLRPVDLGSIRLQKVPGVEMPKLDPQNIIPAPASLPPVESPWVIF